MNSLSKINQSKNCFDCCKTNLISNSKDFCFFVELYVNGKKKFLLFCKKSEMTTGILNSLIKLAKLKKKKISSSFLLVLWLLDRFLAAKNNKKWFIYEKDWVEFNKKFEKKLSIIKWYYSSLMIWGVFFGVLLCGGEPIWRRFKKKYLYIKTEIQIFCILNWK